MIRNKTNVPTLATIIQHILEVLITAIREEKVTKEIQTGKEVKLSLFADEIILYIKNCNDIIRKLLKLINEFSKATGHKISTQKSPAFQKIRKRN